MGFLLSKEFIIKMDLDLRVNKFQKDAEKRHLLAKQQLEDKKRLEKQKQIRLEEEQKRKELLAAKRLEEERLAEEEFLRTNGITFKREYIVIPIEGEDDRITLPTDALQFFTEKDAFQHGPLMFEISSNQGNHITHCGVREFSAPDGTIGLPEKVLKSLLVSDSDSSSHNSTQYDIQQITRATIKYLPLPKITSVIFRPKLNLFSTVGPIKAVLEENLRKHCTMTKGDVVTVWYRGQPHELIVRDIIPEEGRGTLIDTDVEVDIDVSEEYQKHAEEQQHVASQHVNRLSDARFPSTDAKVNQPTEVRSVSPPSLSVPKFEIPAEPVEGDDTILIKIKVPSGESLTRRFLYNDTKTIAHIFGYIKSSMTSLANEELQLTIRQPPIKVLESEAAEAGSLSDRGVNGKTLLVLISLANKS